MSTEKPSNYGKQVLIARLEAQPASKRPTTRSPAARAKRRKATSTRNVKAIPDAETEENLDNPAELVTPNADETGEEPYNESQPLITMDQITMIVSAIVESKMATLANPPPQQAGISTVDSTVNFGDPNFVQQLLATRPSNSCDVVAHVDKKKGREGIINRYR